MANDTINSVAPRSTAVSTQQVASNQTKRQDAVASSGNQLPAADVQTEKTAAPSQQELSAVVAELNSQLQSVERNLQFSIDDGSGQTIVKVVNTETEELVRQIPSEELLRISERIREQQDSNPGLIFEISA